MKFLKFIIFTTDVLMNQQQIKIIKNNQYLEATVRYKYF